VRLRPAASFLEFFVVRLGCNEQQAECAFDLAGTRNVEIGSPGILSLQRQPPKAKQPPNVAVE
jgi:hypothetical protein